MIYRFVSIILITFFSLSTFSAEAQLHELTEANISMAIETETAANDEADHCDDCHHDGCDEGDNCCLSLCSCTSLKQSQRFSLSKPNTFISITKVDWYFFNAYLSPHLDPALKPPLFA